MHEIKLPISIIENNKFQLSIDNTLYKNEVITASCYKFSDKYFISQMKDQTNSEIINIIFESKDSEIITELIPKQFCNELIDQQIRYNTNLQFGKIRDMIVEEAFKPISK